MDHIETAQQALRALTLADDDHEREKAAVSVINAVLNAMEGVGAYNVLATALTRFTAAQPVPWQSLSYVIQGVMSGWNHILDQETKAPE